ncbi:MAG: anti-sigma factor [Gemmatimonadales bacterium]
MSDLDRLVAGLRCREVLTHLSDFLDGELSPELTRQITAHLADCDWCERFGDRMGTVVGRLRGALAEDVPSDVVARLRSRIRGAASEG